jgi:phospholipase C
MIRSLSFAQTTVSAALLLGASFALACSSSSGPEDASTDGGAPKPDAAHEDSGKDAGHDAAKQPDAGKDAGASDASQDGAPDGGIVTSSAIEHLVLIVQENHTFDNYFGQYCTAPTGSNPTCTAGPACCEAGPAMDPSGASPAMLDDTTNGNYDPNHLQACEIAEMDMGAMDKYVTGAPCASPGNFAYADSAAASTYWQLAGQGAIADRYFQPVAGASSSNDMYFAEAKFVFLDDEYETQSKGASCQIGLGMSYTDPTIANLLLSAGATFGVYAGGYGVAAAASPNCATVPPACPGMHAGYPCVYDPADIPFEYYPSLRDNPLYMKDFTQFSTDVSGGKLPSFSFVKSIGYLSEHPGDGDTISGGETFVQGVIDAVEASPYAANTLILVTWDESGGYFDHIAPPAASTVDNKPYGPRIPLIAVGPFAAKGVVSHVQMEHSSIVTFLEWNWLGGKTGQLKTRDAVVHNIGSLLDPTKTGTAVPN